MMIHVLLSVPCVSVEFARCGSLDAIIPLLVDVPVVIPVRWPSLPVVDPCFCGCVWL